MWVNSLVNTLLTLFLFTLSYAKLSPHGEKSKMVLTYDVTYFENQSVPCLLDVFLINNVDVFLCIFRNIVL